MAGRGKAIVSVSLSQVAEMSLCGVRVTEALSFCDENQRLKCDGPEQKPVVLQARSQGAGTGLRSK